MCYIKWSNSVSAWFPYVIHEYHWLAWNSSLLCFSVSQPSFISILSSLHSKSSSDFQNFANPPNIQIITTCYWPENTWNHPKKQPQVFVSSFTANFLTSNHRELLLLTMTVSMGMLIFAGLGYALEKDEQGTKFTTLPQTLYWAIITMTSTGLNHKLYIYIKIIMNYPCLLCSKFGIFPSFDSKFT